MQYSCVSDDACDAVVAAASRQRVDGKKEHVQERETLGRNPEAWRQLREARRAWQDTPEEVFARSGWSGVRRAAVAAVHRACDAAEQWEPGLGALLAEDARRSRMLGELKGALARAGAAEEEVREGGQAGCGRVEAGNEDNDGSGQEDEARAEGLMGLMGGGRASETEATAEVPLLLGVPVAVKDLVHVDGFSTQAGALLGFPALDSVLWMKEGEIIQRLRSAGAIVLGKAAMTEFAYRHPSRTRNPLAPCVTPGGSSSGSAAVVAAGICPLALASQTCASISRPAAFTATVGFKPSHRRLLAHGCVSPSPSLDQFGVIAASVRWAALWAQAVLPGWQSTPCAAAQAPLCVAIPDGPLVEQCEEGAAREGFQQLLTWMRTSRAWRVVSLPCLHDLQRIKESV
ncbi:hypothetical protein CLOM_g11758 [Closterium sp. NIES-68]|nr:hypothetical protein CLOM_g11758 [Closterium sp. NIES-68]GJP76554.1 hypothetical protein CLOP_g6980 [Closterium sp. NIES-67]